MRCIPTAWNNFKCFYQCFEGFRPLNKDPSQGCFGKLDFTFDNHKFIFLNCISDPCIPESQDYCSSVAHATVAHCASQSATINRCHYTCERGYFPIQGNASLGCQGIQDELHKSIFLFNHPFQILANLIHVLKT